MIVQDHHIAGLLANFFRRGSGSRMFSSHLMGQRLL